MDSVYKCYFEAVLSFNSRPQSFCPMVEQDTSKEMVLSMGTANKLCSKHSCDHYNKCSKKVSSAGSISSNRTKLTREIVDKINIRAQTAENQICNVKQMQVLRSIKVFATIRRALYHREFTYAPKCTVRTRNFTSLCHSAVHPSKIGTGKSSLSLAKM